MADFFHSLFILIYYLYRANYVVVLGKQLTRPEYQRTAATRNKNMIARKKGGYFFLLFPSSCLNEEECELLESDLLDHYYNCLNGALESTLKKNDIEDLNREWKSLYKYAWADFYRFLDGWSPGHWKMHDYSRKMKSDVLAEIGLSTY